MPPLALIRPCQRGASAWIALPEAADWPVIGVLSPTFLVPWRLVVLFGASPPQATASRVPAIPRAHSLVSPTTSLLLGLAALAAPVYISARPAPVGPRPGWPGRSWRASYHSPMPGTPPERIRNFCIIAHIDHGKSTLADRLLELTGAVPAREMVDQMLDTMDLERERGITIKLQAVRLSYVALSGETYELHLIDTPGHVDFSYEVSRSLAACEGAVLVVDAAQGIEAQTLANMYQAVEAGLTLVPVVNKIDLPAAQPDLVAAEIAEVTGLPASSVLFVSAKEAIGIREVLEALIREVPPPRGS